MLRVDGSWPFSFCISGKKFCGALFMGFWLLESILSCIYLLMFSSESFLVLFLFVFIYLFTFGCVTPDMFKGKCHVQSSSLVNIRCPSVIGFRLWLQRTASKLQGFFIPSSFRLASTTLELLSSLVIHYNRMS